MAQKKYAHLAIQTLQGGETLRVWSFLVTLFGDITRGQSSSLSGQSLTALTDGVGIKPATMRVALHRLRKDGWIESRKQGRESWFCLSSHGRAETIAFSRRVYDLTSPDQALSKVNWQIFVSDESVTQSTPQGMIAIPNRTGIYLGPANTALGTGFLTVSGALGPVPVWLQDALFDPQLCKDYAAFEARLDTARTQLPTEISMIDRAILRGLTIHTWRRLLLRHPHLPNAFWPPTLRLAECRMKVGHILAALGEVSASDLS